MAGKQDTSLLTDDFLSLFCLRQRQRCHSATAAKISEQGYQHVAVGDGKLEAHQFVGAAGGE